MEVKKGEERVHLDSVCHKIIFQCRKSLSFVFNDLNIYILKKGKMGGGRGKGERVGVGNRGEGKVNK